LTCCARQPSRRCPDRQPDSSTSRGILHLRRAPTQNAPALVRDDRCFSQTGYRIDVDEVWNFFNQYGGITTFGYPTSRMMPCLGCPLNASGMFWLMKLLMSVAYLGEPTCGVLVLSVASGGAPISNSASDAANRTSSTRASSAESCTTSPAPARRCHCAARTSYQEPT
jgi:hypothetical protein